MLKRILAFILSGAAALFVVIKALLNVASMASTIDFVKNRLPSLIQLPKKAQWQVLAFVAGVAIGASLHEITIHPRVRSNADVQLITTLTKRDEDVCRESKETNSRARPINPQISKRRAWQQQAAEMSSFEQEMERSLPPFIVSTSSADVTNRSLEMCNEHNQQAVIRFLSRFSVPVADIIRDSRERGLYASPLEGHMAALNSIPMMRLVAADVSSLADQLDKRTATDGSASGLH